MKKILAICLLVLAACGKRGDPHPPIPAIPKATSDLLVTQRGTKVILTWSYPSLTTAGKSLPGFRRVTVYRHAEEIPVPVAGQTPVAIVPADAAATKTDPLALFAKVPPIAPMQFNRLKQTVDSLEGVRLPQASVGAKLQYEDTPPLRTKAGQPVRLTYAVVTFGESARSDLSNLAMIVPLDAPEPPGALAAAAKPQGIVLSWNAPEKSASGAGKPLIAGYNVYRVPAAQPGDDLGTPVNAALVTTTSYTDVPAYGEFRYRVTTVALATPRIESESSAPVSATFKDLLPPPPPPSVSALVETKSVRLIWEPVDAPDLKGYIIYRYEGPARLRLTPGPATIPNFVDISIELGIEYTYAITSIDKSGNESAETFSEKVLVPKTP